MTVFFSTSVPIFDTDALTCALHALGFPDARVKGTAEKRDGVMAWGLSISSLPVGVDQNAILGLVAGAEADAKREMEEGTFVTYEFQIVEDSECK